MNQSQKSQLIVAGSRANLMAKKGFALISTITIMALLMLIAVAILSLSSVEVKSATVSMGHEEARANARMALMLAIADLQSAAGSDQRITAKADVLSDSLSVTEGRAHWVGVWDTKNYSPKEPNNREFVRWLVSSPDSSKLNLPEDVIGVDDVVIFEGVNGNESVKIPKVNLTGNGGMRGSYAYWVEDEGVKADLDWDEGEYVSDEKAQFARLSAVPGPDYDVFEGPFKGEVSYPIELDSGNPWLENMEKALSAGDTPLVMNSSGNEHDWLKEKRHDITLGSLGVMSDVKLGGLRRDLSLAFEMDGEAAVATWDASTASFSQPNLPTKFNEQYHEFVGESAGSDILTGGQVVDGLTARYIYGNNSSSGYIFSDEIPFSVQAIRGPTWFALRDFANSYKRLKGASGNYTISSRPTYPNSKSSSSPLPVIDMNGSLQASAMYDGYNPTGGAGVTRYLEKPFQPNYMPVTLGYTVVLSVMSVPSDDGDKLALGVDPIFYIWNPYNHRLSSERHLISYRTALPGQIRIWMDGVALPNATVRSYLGRAAGFNPRGTHKISYTIRDLDLAPGEVKIFSPPTDPALVSSGSAHPYNTDALEGADLSATSGALITKFPPNWSNSGIKLSDFNQVTVGFTMTGSPDDNFVYTSFPRSNVNNTSFRRGDIGHVASASLPRFYYNSEVEKIEEFLPAKNMGELEEADAAGPYTSGSIGGSKQFCGVFSMLTSPANFTGPKATPVEIFARFNPLAQAIYGNDNISRAVSWNQEVVIINKDFGSNFTEALESTGVVIPAIPVAAGEPPVNGYWGNSYAGDGTGSLVGTVVPAIEIPTGPVMSLAHFAHANLGVLSDDPLFAIGNSLASIFINPVSPYGAHAEDMNGRNPTASDSSWLLNDALFDRYYLSGIAPEFTLDSSYVQTGSLEDTLGKFYGDDYKEANANPVLRPYLPIGIGGSDAVSALTTADGKGYLKMGAYSMINGMFNVNSTSLDAWTAFLRGNRGMAVHFAQGGKDEETNESPFPRGTAPVSSPQASSGWSELSRLSDAQIDDLAGEIVNQVRLRGPFMSLADFVNHRVGTPVKNETHYMGALQAAIEASGINSSVNGNAGGTVVDYGLSALSSSFNSPISGERPTTTGIVTDITQADLLMSLAPRLSARSDTFRIRAYGEALSNDGTRVLAKVMCEAVIQRFPEYVDANDEPWLEANYDPFSNSPGDPRIEKSISNLSAVNQKYGRRFRVVKFRWLGIDEI